MTNGGPHNMTLEGVRILLTDDHAVMRQALRVILEHNSEVEVVGEAANGVEAVSMAAALRPDLVIMDVNMPRMDGIQATKQIKTARPATIVIGLSVIDDKHVTEAMKAAGAEAVLLKDAAEQLHEAIATLVQRGTS